MILFQGFVFLCLAVASCTCFKLPILDSNTNTSLSERSDGKKRRELASGDYKTWSVATSTASWSARYDIASAVVGSTVYVMGGYDNSYSYKNDVWKSDTFGASWTLVTATALWSGRRQSAAVVVGSSIVILGGWGEFKS